MTFGTHLAHLAHRKIFGYRAIVDFSRGGFGGHFSKWLPEFWLSLAISGYHIVSNTHNIRLFIASREFYNSAMAAI